jgi:hypothetical protein
MCSASKLHRARKKHFCVLLLSETLNTYSTGENTNGSPRLLAGEDARATHVQGFLSAAASHKASPKEAILG